MGYGTNVNIISTAQFQQFAPDADISQYNDPTVSGIISQASQIVADYLEYTPVAEALVDEQASGIITTDGDLVIYPNKIPIIEVTGLFIAKGATSIAITLTNSSGTPKYNLDYTNRYIRYPYGEITLQGVPIFTNFYSLRGTQFYTRLSYRAGFEPYNMPPSIIQATILIVRDILAKKYNQSGATKIQQGGISLEFSQFNAGESALMKEAKRLLGPYRR